MKTVVLGASENPERYANIAVRLLREHGHDVAAVGIKEGSIGDVPILTGNPSIESVDTVSLYVGPPRQEPLIDYVISLHPRRVIFNPGTENPAFVERLGKAGIESLDACTLVMLRTGQW